MQAQDMAVRIVLTIGVALLVTGCVQPYYVQPGPIQLQPYPPMSYQSSPDYRPPVAGPIPLQPPPLVEPLPAPVPAPSVTEEPTDTGPIPMQDMPPPVPDTASSSPSTTPAPPAAAPEVVSKTPTSRPGNNVPLEGFRPMKGQTKPAL